MLKSAFAAITSVNVKRYLGVPERVTLGFDTWIGKIHRSHANRFEKKIICFSCVVITKSNVQNIQFAASNFSWR